MKPVTGLCGSYVRLWQLKQEARRAGLPPDEIEYAPPVVQAKRIFHEWFFKCFELGKDPTRVCTGLIMRMLA